ncbi:phage tail protein [Leclercia sp. S52]|uniref:host specificity protein J n=1 Tax=Leclercia sp. S52 TaxID=3138178 RepID=UPI0032191A8D
MTRSVNDRLQDETIAHGLYVTRYGNGVARRMVTLLSKMDADLAARLLVLLDGKRADTYSARRLASLLAGVRDLNQQAYEPVIDALARELTRYVEYEAGKPTYSSGSEKTRFSSALINFSDPDNHYQDRTTAVMFPELVKQFKFKQTQLTAIGCTRESEAQRRGGWAVYSNSLDRIITLQTGLDGFAYVPGTVFAFADERVSGRVYGGRLTDYNAGLKAVTTDRGTSAVAGDTLMIRTQGGIVESRVIQAVNGTQLIVATPFTAAPAPNAVFVIDAGQLRLQYFRVTNLTFNDEENTYSITGAEYNASKYDAVDHNARLDIPPISLIPTGVVSQPGNIVVSSYESVRQGQRIATLTASWDVPLDKAGKPQADVIAYQAQWRRNDSEWVNVPQTGLRNIEVPGIFEGDYLVRVRAINSGGASSLWATSTLTHLKGRVGDVPKPVNFRTTPLLWGGAAGLGFPCRHW